MDDFFDVGLVFGLVFGLLIMWITPNMRTTVYAVEWAHRQCMQNGGMAYFRHEPMSSIVWCNNGARFRGTRHDY